MGVAHEKMCGIRLATGDAQRALPNCQQALDLYERLHSSDRLDAQALDTVATGHLWMHRVFSALGRLGQAETELVISTDLLAKVLELQKDNLQARRDFAYNALYSSMLNERVSKQPNVTARQKAERRQRAVADYERGREILKALATADGGTAADNEMLQKTRALLGTDIKG